VPYTLLLADDSVTIQRVIELTFADEDVTVVAVSDGDQAIERLDASPPDIVLADIGMPGKNGYEVAQYIRQTPRLAHIPVVLLTGAFEPVDQARAAEAGCDGVLAKPFEPQLVIGRVKELLARAHRPPDTLDPSLSAPPADPSGHWPHACRDTVRASRPGRLFRSTRRRVFDDAAERADAGRAACTRGGTGRRYGGDRLVQHGVA
jgi:CheY-like chemotaxis protein